MISFILKVLNKVELSLYLTTLSLINGLIKVLTVYFLDKHTIIRIDEDRSN